MPAFQALAIRTRKEGTEDARIHEVRDGHEPVTCCVVAVGGVEMEEAVRLRYTPSMNTPTDGSIPALLAPLPKPRMKKPVLADDWR